MPAPSIEPLQPELWFEQIRTIAARISRLDGEAPDAVIRKAYFLVQLAPTPLRDVISCLTEEAAFERMLENGAYDSAVAALICPPAGFEISREPGQDAVKAVVRLPGDAGTGESGGKTIALALLAAWSRCLDSLLANATLDLTLDRGPRKGPPGLPPHSSRH